MTYTNISGNSLSVNMCRKMPILAKNVWVFCGFGVCSIMPLDCEVGPVKIYSPGPKDTRWRVAWKPSGMPRQLKDRRTKKDALELAREIKSQLKRGELGKIHRITQEDAELLELCHKLNDPKRVLEDAIKRQHQFQRVSIAECCDRYIAEYQDYESRSTRGDANRKANVIKRTLGDRYIDSLTEGDIEQWRGEKLTGGSRYRNNILSHLRHIYERARVWRYVPKGYNPARDVPNLKIKKGEPEVWRVEELQNSLQWYEDSSKATSASRIVFLALGAFAGMRPSEIEGVVGERDGLLWQDIDFEKRYIRIRPEVAGKLSEPRYIMFTPKPDAGLGEELADEMWSVLSKWLLPIKKDSGPVTFRKCQCTMSPELKEAGIIDQWANDGLRHTWISCLLALGVSRDWIAELAGNSSEVIRTNYKRPMADDVAREWFRSYPVS